MNFVTPELAAVAAGILAPSLVILYFLKLRRREVEISSTLLWKKSVHDLQANAPFQRLRRNILLFIQLLLLCAGLLALAQPERRAEQPPGQRSVILIDRSASMSARDDGAESEATRLDSAKGRALSYLETLRGGGLFSSEPADEAMVIAFDAGATVVQPMTSDAGLLRRAIESIEPTDGRSSIEEALRLAGTAGRMLNIEGRGLVRVPGPPAVVFSDGKIADAERIDLPAEAAVRFERIGAAETGNIAITALGAERSYERAEQLSLFVGVQSTFREPRNVDAELWIDGALSAARSVELAAAGEAPAGSGAVFTLERAAGAVVSVRMRVNDALEADNAAFLVVPAAKRLSVALVTTGAPVIESGLEALKLQRLDVISPVEAQKLIDEGGAERYDVMVLDRWIPAGPSMPDGRWLVLGEAPRMRGIDAERNEQPSERRVAAVTDWARAHPALRGVSLGNLLFDSAVQAVVTKEASVLVSSSAGPAVVECTQGASRAIAVLFEPLRSNWPFDVSFILFLAQAVQDLGDDGGGPDRSLMPGQTLTSKLPAGVERATLRTPDGRSVELSAGPDGVVTFGAVKRVGVYELSWSGPAGPEDEAEGSRARRFFAASMLDGFESDLGSAESLTLGSGAISGGESGSAGVKGSQRLWPLLLVGAATLLVLEWIVFNRRVHL